LDIPGDVLKEAMRITKAKTKSEAVRTALEMLIKHEQRMKLLTYQGKVDLKVDLDILRQRG
jgi:Arc/MetJ family transcription regulator